MELHVKSCNKTYVSDLQLSNLNILKMLILIIVTVERTIARDNIQHSFLFDTNNTNMVAASSV
jgi:hypothetical protein